LGNRWKKKKERKKEKEEEEKKRKEKSTHISLKRLRNEVAHNTAVI